MQLLRHKFTVEKYHKMALLGILSDRDRSELIRGEIIEMSPIGTRHAAYVRLLDILLSEKLRRRALVDTQNPIELDNLSEPQLDIALLQPREDFYESAHPTASDIFLIIEVSDTTAKYDREIKIPLYAENNVIKVWLVDINQQCIEVYRDPALDNYRTVEKFGRGQTLSIQTFPDITIAVDEIVGI